MENPPAEHRDRLYGALGALALALVCLAAYFPSFSNGFIWDDEHYIENNLPLRSAQGLVDIWTKIDSEPQFYPLTHSTFWIEWHLWGSRPLGYHIDNLILHAAGAIALWRLLLRLKIPGALPAAMIWAIHPMQVESVAWATERKNVLSGLLYFLSLYAYLRSSDNGLDIRWYIPSLLLFVGALLSKSVTSTLPAVILLIYWWQGRKIRWDDIQPLLPFFFAGIGMGALTGWMEKHVVGAVGPEFQFSILERIGIAGHVIFFYLLKLIWPAHLSFFYPRWNFHVAGNSLILIYPAAGVLLALILFFLRTRVGRGPLVCYLFFVGTLTPALGFVNVYPMQFSFVADHFQYLACIGPIVLVVALASQYVPRPLTLGLSGALVAFFCVDCSVRSRVYENRLTLWQDTVAQNPDSPYAHHNLGQAFESAGDLDSAQYEFHMALDLHTPHPWLAQLSLGQLAEIRGNLPAAIDWYTYATDSMPDSPEPILEKNRAIPYFALGQAMMEWSNQPGADSDTAHGRREQAIEAFEVGMLYDSSNESAILTLARILAADGRQDDAIAICRQALKEHPEFVQIRKALGAN